MAETILLIGDSHGDIEFIRWAIDKAVEHEIDHLVQLGDFGYWEHHRSGQKFLARTEQALEEADLTLHWLDGNHENHTLLRAAYGNEGFTPIRERIIYLPRGTRWVWDNVSFLAIGGAYSIDGEWRRQRMEVHPQKQHELWWPEETITDREVEVASRGGHVDVVLSHDVPRFVDLTREIFTRGLDLFKWDDNSLMNRQKLSEVFDAVSPKAWYHGHYHLDYTQKIDLCKFQGLAANINQFGLSDWSYEKAVTVISTGDFNG